MILNSVTTRRPRVLDYSLLGDPDGPPTSQAVVIPRFASVPIRVQSECRRISYTDHFPRRIGRKGVFPQFHRYDPDSEQVLGIFGDIGPHRDGPTDGDKRLTAGLILVNDGNAKLVTGKFTSRGKATEDTACWPLPVGSLYLMDSSQEHTTLSEDSQSLLAFAAFDFSYTDSVPARELRKGAEDVLRRVFGYELDQITVRWAGGSHG